MFWLGGVAALLFWPGIAGASLAPRWVFLSIALPIILMVRDRHHLTVPHIIGFAFIGWAAVSISWTAWPEEVVPSAMRLMVLALAFHLGSTLDRDEMKRLLVGAAAGLTVSSALCIPQFFGWQFVPQANPPAGLFVNKNTLCETAAIVAAGCIAYRIWLPAVLLAPAIILPAGRAGWLGFAVGIAFWVRRDRFALAMMGLALVAISTPTLVGFTLPGTTFVGYGSGDIIHRLEMWQDIIDGARFAGFGFGSFAPAFQTIKHHWSEATIPFQAHNELLHQLLELGVPGAALWLLFFISVGPRRGTDPSPEHIVLVVMLVEACFAFPLQLPLGGFIALAAAGRAARVWALAWPMPADGRVLLCPRVVGESAGRDRGADRSQPRQDPLSV